MIRRTISKTPSSVWVLVLGMCAPVLAMDRWTALSQIESGDNDHAIGRQGEVSRYQIMPKVWRRYASAKADWRKPADSLLVARIAMRDRLLAFERRFHRAPTDLEFYVLWNAPSQIGRPSRCVINRAKRFQNLLAPDSAPARQTAIYSRLPGPPSG
jgi:hypothetical protein